ncbi:Structural maintenance of chromosomes protein 6 [Conoideocrella luteorostrata]|uniref:Structural maintenance of chromosomes protein 6 n=1 Tax=Conoideocrella luteorostrata TaxID=1105319 RepID=A0AAJ0CYU7_9HYPO|nr:Structural maintenance of chromosomes protein 6 [Conoideocrella luteorostrata]
MAPIKRTRAADSGDQEDPHDQEEHTSLNRESQLRKRPRVSEDLPTRVRLRSATYDAQESSDEEFDDNSNRVPSPPQTQYELMRDAGFKHLRDTDKDDLEATQKLRQRPANVGNNMAAEGGIIESITCYNFMCHERLHVELGPLINFIVGENGSGKSAVLTALTLCLGGKASDTNRGGSLKSFVKEGQDHGSLVVKIKNAGSDAYQHDIYGDSILVERHFSKSGSSGFKIKTAQGRIISTKKQEVDEISEWYALQMGNPLMVLSQDNARQFLNSATPAQKYKYFVSGVQLEQLDNDYKMSQDTLDKTLIVQEDLEGKAEEVRREMEDSQRLAETVTRNSSLREKARHICSQLVWSQVVEQERSFEKQSEELEALAQQILNMERDCDETTVALNDVVEKVERARASRDSLNDEYGSIEESIVTAEGAWNKAKRELTDLQREERDAHARLKTTKSDIETYETKIREELEKLNESTGSARVDKDTEHEHALARQANLQQQIDDCTHQLPVLQSRVADTEKLMKRHQQLKDVKRKDILAAEQGVRELEKSTGSVYDGFDRDISQLVKVIAADSGFDCKPLGPLGAHIKLTKPEWSGILEKTLGEALNAFVVRSKRDQSRLSGLIRQSNMKRQPPVYIAYGGRIDTRNQEPAEEFDTILRVLEFDEDLVRSQLIINNQIDKVILVKDRVQAETIMIDNGPPCNVVACICFHDGKGKRGQGLRITNRASTIGTSPVIPSNMRPRMQSDSARQLSLQKDNLKHLGLELREINSEERLAQQSLHKTRSELEKLRKNIKALENDLRRTQADIEKVLEELDSFEGVDARLDSLRSELATKRAEEDQLGNQYGNMRLEKRELNARAEAAKINLDSARSDQKDFQTRVDKADAKIHKYDSMRRIALAKKNQAFETVDMEKSALQRARAKCAEKSEEVQNFIRQAKSVAPVRVHIPHGDNHRSLEKKYEKIREQLALREARLGATEQEIYDRARDARRSYDDYTRETQVVDETIKSLKHALADRLGLWRQFQRQISARIRIQFNYLLSERGFRGKIDLDHPNRKVNVHIEPDETRKSAAGRNTKTLSGGEKSFSSICMLLSVWEAIGSPIRCLDEFDVFMDNVNRAISTNMLVDTARRSVSRQYILITPNAIEGRARLDKDVKIIRLTDPRQRILA